MLTIALQTGTAGNWTSSVKASEIDHWCTNKQRNIEGTTNIIHIEGKCYFGSCVNNYFIVDLPVLKRCH